jgi:hypothetical protein
MKYSHFVFFLSLVLFLFIHNVAFAQIEINEVAWMGTVTSANDEWIELRNTGSESVDITGWVLQAVDGAPEFTLTGSIAPGAYFLMERSDDATIPDISADMLYTGSLGNIGEFLQLRDATGSIIDSVDHADGWQGGDNVTKETMQRKGSLWITASPTPRAENNTEDSLSGDTSSDQADQDSSGVRNTTVADERIEIIKKEEDPQYFAELEIPEKAFTKTPVHFYGKVIERDVTQLRGQYYWNFGDGTVVQYNARRTSDFNLIHQYDHEGVYVISFEYREGTFSTDR